MEAGLIFARFSLPTLYGYYTIVVISITNFCAGRLVLCQQKGQSPHLNSYLLFNTLYDGSCSILPDRTQQRIFFSNANLTLKRHYYAIIIITKAKNMPKTRFFIFFNSKFIYRKNKKITKNEKNILCKTKILVLKKLTKMYVRSHSSLLIFSISAL